MPLPPARPQLFGAFTKKAAKAPARKPQYETVTVRPSFAIPTVLLGAPRRTPPCCLDANSRVLCAPRPGPSRASPIGLPLPPPPLPAGAAAASHFAHVDAVSYVTGALGAFLAFQANRVRFVFDGEALEVRQLR